MKWRWCIPFLALCVTGCVKEKVEVVVNPDGSGIITLDMSISAEMLAMTKEMSADLGSAAGGNATEPFIKDEEVGERAKDFGSGVTLKKIEHTKPGGGEGCTATFGFADIRKVRLPLMDSKNGGEDTAKDNSKNVTFEFTEGPTSRKLVVHVPQQEESKTADVAAKEPGPEPEAAMVAGMMEMFKGMEVQRIVKVNGEVVASTASHPQGDARQGALLMSVNFDELRKNPEFVKIFTSSQGGDFPAEKLKGMSGFSYETKPAIAIEFK